MRKMGLNGRSVVPLISGLACAVPAIMAARMIPDKKERFITIMVTPFMSCAARLPVYAVIIALVIPSERLFGIFHYQGLAMTTMYVIGIGASLGVGWILSKTLPESEEGSFMLELPVYRWPSLTNLVQKVIIKVRQFVFNAGKVILVISILLWLGASFGPGDSFDQIEQTTASLVLAGELDESVADLAIAREQLEASYVGRLGKAIEPAIAPLGYDWKIGIALVTSFAAREVFVGTVSTIYSLGDNRNPGTLVERLGRVMRPDGTPMYDLALGVSLLLFYAFAMQCMSTVAIVKSETGSWKYAIMQMIGMTSCAYLSSLIAYQLLS
jgi:ferrous iron transport protein B